MATPSCWEKELKQHEVDVPAGLKKKVTRAPGDVQGTGNRDIGTRVPTTWSDRSLSGGGTAARFGTAGDSTCAVAAPGAILNIAEDPGSPSMDCEESMGHPELQGSQSPLAELRRVGREPAKVSRLCPRRARESRGKPRAVLPSSAGVRPRPGAQRKPVGRSSPAA